MYNFVWEEYYVNRENHTQLSPTTQEGTQLRLQHELLLAKESHFHLIGKKPPAPISP